MPEPMRSRRRIEHLKQLAYDCNLTNEQARVFGKLTATATWEKLLLAHGLEFDRSLSATANTPAPATRENPRQGLKATGKMSYFQDNSFASQMRKVATFSGVSNKKVS